jgi:3-dehydroquinate synthase
MHTANIDPPKAMPGRQTNGTQRKSAERGIITIPVDIPARKSQQHDILIGHGILGELPKKIIALDLPRDILIISGRRIFELYGEKLESVFKGDGWRIKSETFVDREDNKSLEIYGALVGKVFKAEEEFGSRVLIVNLGGGVVMDVGGFVAATYDRGRDYIQLPTTLLGDVDCGIGGKTGVNLNETKNKIGRFHQPRLILADLSFLRSLPEREIRSGLAEVIKYGMILDAKFFEYIEVHTDEARRLEPQVIEHIIRKSFDWKTQIVKKDEEDKIGERAKLNFGHTVGHALEGATKLTRYAHGEAIAIGMLCACEIAEGLGMFTSAQTKRLEALCQSVGLPTQIDASISIDAIMSHMQHDKKFVAGKNRFVLPTRIGEVVLCDDVPDLLIRRVIKGRTARI